ncbi:MAG: DEAD/DEAH box helicase, partial [Phycisphaerae bacterium]|nr:DEAD/DEAH box helicase [Phycisphaerae bacterium]
MGLGGCEFAVHAELAGHAGAPMSADWLARIDASEAVSRIAAAVESGGAVSARGAAGSSTTVIASRLAVRLDRPVLLVAAHLDEAAEMVDEIEELGCRAELFPAIEALPGESAAALDLVAARLRFVDRLGAEQTGRAAGTRAAELAAKIASAPSSRKAAFPAAPAPTRVEAGEHAAIVIVAPIAALMQGVPDRTRQPKLLRRLRRGERVNRRELVEWLADGGYRRGETVEQPGDFAVRGGLVDIHPPGGSAPVRLDFLGDELERIFEIDPATQASDRAIDEVSIVSASADAIQSDAGTVQLASLLPRRTVAVIAELAEVTEQARGYWERVHDSRGVFPPPEVFRSLGSSLHAVLDVNQFSAGNASNRIESIPVRALPGFPEQVGAAFDEIATMASEMPLSLLCDNEGEEARARELLATHAPGAAVAVERRHLHRGFIWGDASASTDSSRGANRAAAQFAVVPQHEVLHRWMPRRRVLAPTIGRAAAREAFLQFAPGDFVVHRDHGIALYSGLARLPEARGGPDEEFLTLEFDGAARLHVPASRVDLIQKYVGAGGAKPKLSMLGGKRWKNQKARVEEAVLDLAAELLRVQAVREATPGIRFPDDTEWQREFEAEFPYEETEDQLSAIAALKRDMARARPMDRLVCGDVGFGKTEVAIRGAFKAVEFGKQVAVLVPTTVLAEQHERTFRERFAGYPFRIESLSRFKTSAEQRAILDDAAAGRVDVLIGTHRLLSADVRLKDLGLVVVDEEQRFGVEHKQRLLEFRVTADVLTLSATPIPRTLHMALLGLRDISSLTTPPPDRRAIVTEVIPWNDRRILQAIRRELAREGQIFFVHNRVRSIERVADRVRSLVPEARVIVGHGQMSAG